MRKLFLGLFVGLAGCKAPVDHSMPTEAELIETYNSNVRLQQQVREALIYRSHLNDTNYESR